MQETVFVGTTPGLEGVLAEELAELGFEGEPTSGGVTIEGPQGSYRTINLWSRIASRVLLRVAEVPTPDTLRKLKLREYGENFEVDAFGIDPGKWGGVLPSTPGAVKLLLRGTKNGCQVSLDTSGELLHFRGYRQEVGRAPMRETLAAGVLRLGLVFVRRHRHLIASEARLTPDLSLEFGLSRLLFFHLGLHLGALGGAL